MDIPAPVKRTFARLGAGYNFYIVLKQINGHFYVYRQKSVWDKAKKAQRIESEYLGRITREGAFLKKSYSRKEKDLEMAKALIESSGGRISWSAADTQHDLDLAIDPVDETILVELSGNARESMAKIGSKVGLSESAVSNRIRNLEERYGLRYTLDATLERFHHYQFVATAKFDGDKPDYTELSKLLEKDPRVRLVLSTKGAYDLFIFMFAQGPLEAEDTIYKLRSTPLLERITATWNVTYHSQSHGFIPFRDKFFELVRDRVWRREKGSARKGTDQFFFREYATLSELNQNSRMPFKLIDEKHSLKGNSARYTYEKLMESGSVRNATITMDKPPVKGTAVFVVEQVNIGDFNKSKADLFKYRLSDEGLPLNKFIFSGDMGSPYGLLLIAPIYENGDLEKLESELLQTAKGTRVKTALVSDILLGNLGYRKLEGTRTHLYKRLQEEMQKERVDTPDYSE